MPETRLALPKGYEALLRDLKERIGAAQVRAALAVNRELVLLYWSIGRDILARQKEHGWGAEIIDGSPLTCTKRSRRSRGSHPAT
jgi:DUF1016 N-terminal domain